MLLELLTGLGAAAKEIKVETGVPGATTDGKKSGRSRRNNRKKRAARGIAAAAAAVETKRYLTDATADMLWDLAASIYSNAQQESDIASLADQIRLIS